MVLLSLTFESQSPSFVLYASLDYLLCIDSIAYLQKYIPIPTVPILLTYFPEITLYEELIIQIKCKTTINKI